MNVKKLVASNAVVISLESDTKMAWKIQSFNELTTDGVWHLAIFTYDINDVEIKKGFLFRK